MENMRGMGRWYFKGYEPVTQINEKGKPTTVYVYKGSYYSIVSSGKDWNSFRAKLSVYGLLFISSLLSGYFMPGTGPRSWPGYLCLISLIPTIFLIAGIVHLLRCGIYLTHRNKCAGINYSYYAALTLFALQVTALLWDIALCITGISAIEEVPFLLTLLIGLICSLLILILFRRHPLRNAHRIE